MLHFIVAEYGNLLVVSILYSVCN